MKHHHDISGLCLAIAYTLLLASGFAVAADVDNDGEALDEIVVVAHKAERSIREVAANVTVVSRDTLDANLAISVDDLFRYTPGINGEAAGTRFGTEGISIRGIGGNRVATLIDGVPLSDRFAVGSFSNATRDFLDTGFVQAIEVLHGPASALYGSSAIGGVVAVRTPDPVNLVDEQGTGGRIDTTWQGSEDAGQVSGLIAAKGRSLGVVAGISHRSGHEIHAAAVDDNLDRRSANRDSALLKFVVDDALGNTLRVSGIRQESGVFSDLNSMLGSGRFRSTTALEGNDDYRTDLVIASYDFGSVGEWFDGGVIRGYHQASVIEQATLDERGLARSPASIERFFSFDQTQRGAEVNLQKTIDLQHSTHKLGFGVEFKRKETREFRDGISTSLVDGSSTNVILGEVFPLRDFPVSVSREWGAYLEDSITLDRFTLIAAVRADRYEMTPQNDPMYAEDYPFATPVSLSESDISPKFGLIYRLRPEVDVYFQYTHGFRAPPYEDANIGLEIPFFNYRAIPNPDLRSESSDGFDVGIRWQGAGSDLYVSAFHTRYTDFIESKVRLGEDPVSGRILFQSRNLAEAVIEGIEAGGSWDAGRLLEGLRIDGALYYARGENEETGMPLNSVGPAQAIAGASWTSADEQNVLRLQMTLNDRWDDRDLTGGELFMPPGHAIFDFYLTRTIGNGVVRIGAYNLTDRTYWRWSSVRGLAADDPILPFASAPGRNFAASVSFSWQ